jgi:hypothetical protein
MLSTGKGLFRGLQPSPSFNLSLVSLSLSLFSLSHPQVYLVSVSFYFPSPSFFFSVIQFQSYSFLSFRLSYCVYLISKKGSARERKEAGSNLIYAYIYTHPQHHEGLRCDAGVGFGRDNYARASHHQQKHLEHKEPDFTTRRRFHFRCECCVNGRAAHCHY